MSKGKLILLGLAGLATAAALIFKSFKSVMNRQTVIEILEALNRQSYELMYQISEMARKMINEKQLLPIQVKEIMEEQDNPVGRAFRNLEKKIYQKYEAKEEDFVYAVHRAYVKDVHVSYLSRLFSETYNKAILGVTPPVFIKSPVFLSEEKVLTIVKQIFDEQIRILSELLKNLKTKISLSNLQQQANTDLLNFKKKLVQGQKLTDFIDNPANLLEFAVKEYSSKDPFAQKYKTACENYEKRVEQTLKNYSQWIEI